MKEIGNYFCFSSLTLRFSWEVILKSTEIDLEVIV